MQNKTCKYLLLFLNYNIKKIISSKFNGFELIARLKFLFSFFFYTRILRSKTVVHYITNITNFLSSLIIYYKTIINACNELSIRIVYHTKRYIFRVTQHNISIPINESILPIPNCRSILLSR